MESELRRYHDHLTVSGAGVIVFSFWSLIKTLVYYMRPRVLTEVLNEMGMEINRIDILYVFGFILVYMSIITLLRIYVGRAAILEGRLGKKGIVYIILAVVAIGDSIWTVVGFFKGGDYVEDDILLSSLLEEIMSILITCDLLFSVWKVRMIERDLKE